MTGYNLIQYLKGMVRLKILHIRLTNFNSIKAAMGLNVLELDFSKIDKPIIQLYARNRCGKSVLLSCLNPFSSINYDGDERNELPSIIRGEMGEKNIVYEIDGKVYNITHTYKPTAKSHSILSSILEDGVELNPSGGVNTFNLLIEKIFGLNKYIFQFIINSTQLTSFAKATTTQRKNRLNKSLGIDIYDKIHKLSTDDYRYANKIIQSLNATKEFLVSTYGTYENLVTQLNVTKESYAKIMNDMSLIKTNSDKLSGIVASLRSQNISSELYEITRQIQAYDEIVSSVGEFSGIEYDRMVNDQIRLNSEVSDLKSQRLLLLKDIDVLYAKKEDIMKTVRNNERTKNDYDNMVKLIENLKDKINNISITVQTTASSERYRSILSHSQTINSICREVVTSLNKNHLQLFTEMIEKGIDISVYLTKESASIMDAEKEKVITSKIHQLMQTANGIFPEKGVCTEGCIYKSAYELLDAYFNSMRSDSPDKMTAFDISNMDQCYKNIQTIERLLSIDVPDELRQMFNIVEVMHNLNNGNFGIDVNYITMLMEEAAKAEQRNLLIKQLSDAETTLSSMQINNDCMDYDTTVRKIDEEINSIKNKCDELNVVINEKTELIDSLDNKRMKLSSIQNVNIKDLRKRLTKLESLNEQLTSSSNQLTENERAYASLQSQEEYIRKNLDKLTHDNTQFINTEHEIAKQLESDTIYKIISEATSSTKGKPVEAIRDTVESALTLTNRLLNVMYDSELEMLSPVINETSFSLPFRVGSNVNADIRYGSQSEQALLSLALSMSLASFLTGYNIFLIDEIDAYLDAVVAELFIMMLSEIMSICKIEQIFLISHHVTMDRCPQYVYGLNLLEEIERQRD